MNKRIVGWLIVTLILAVLTTPGLAASPSEPNQALPDGMDAQTALSATDHPRVGQELIVSAIDNEQYLPSVAYNWKHHEYLVVWHNTWVMGTRDIRARRISDRGQVLNEFTIYDNPTRDSAQPSVAYDPVHDRYLVVWVRDVHGDGSDWDIYGRFIPSQGPNPGLNAFPIITWTTTQWNPKLVYARAQEEFLVVWWNEHPSLPAYTSGKRIYADGNGFPTGGSDVTINHPTQNRVEPDVSYNLARNEYLVVYSNGQLDILGTRLRGDAAKLGGGEFGIAGWPDAESKPAVAACREADQYLVTWQSNQGGNPAIYARFVHGNGTVGSAHLIRATTLPNTDADVACDQGGSQYMVTWQDQYTNHRFGILGRSVRPNANMSDPFVIRHAGGAADRTRPAIAGGAANYLVAWEHERDGTSYQDIHGRLITPNTSFQPLQMRRR